MALFIRRLCADILVLASESRGFCFGNPLPISLPAVEEMGWLGFVHRAQHFISQMSLSLVELFVMLVFSLSRVQEYRV